MKRLFLTFIVFHLLFASCTYNNIDDNKQENQKFNTEQYTLMKIDTVSILLDDKTRYNGTFILQTINNVEYLGVISKNENAYTLYNIEEGEIEKRIKFNREGPNGIGQVRFVRVHTWDSIFVIRYHTNELYLLDSSSKVKQKWKLNETTSGDIIFNIYAMYSFPLVYKRNMLYLMNVGLSKVFTKEFWDVTTGLRFNLQNKNVFNNTGHFPEIYKSGICYGNYNLDNYRIITNNLKIVYSYPLDNNLYIYNDTVLEKTVSLRSPHVKNDAPTPQKILTGYNYDDDWMYEIQRGSYRWMVYDEYNNIIYRLVVHAMEPYDAEGNKNKISDKPVSIQIIDSTFSLVGEVDFPGRQYSFRNMISTKEGLLISLCHTDNPVLEEDKLKLALFKLVKTDGQNN